MKNASKHAATLKSLRRKLCRQHKAADRPELDPLRALVLGVLREDCDDAKANRAMAALDEEFVDVNELRVATELELSNLIGEDYPHVVDRSVRLREILMSVFDAEGRLSIARVAAMNKKEQRATLHGLPMMSPFVEGHVALLGFGQAAVPVDDRMRVYLVSQGVLEPSGTVEEAQRFLESHLKSDECWPFFHACRAEVSKSRPRGGAKKSAEGRAARVAKAGARGKRALRKQSA
jgi:endonuclease III